MSSAHTFSDDESQAEGEQQLAMGYCDGRARRVHPMAAPMARTEWRQHQPARSRSAG
jgi:hypothetical protein